MRVFIILSLLVAGGFPTAAYAQACESLPFWQNTLRCKFFPTTTPPLPPPEPQSLSEIKDFTLVPLPFRNEDGEILRCVDGTRPAIYVDEANTNANNNHWVVTMQGGGSCNDADSCLAAYLTPSETAEMGTAMDIASKNMEGIHRSSSSNAFSNFNRIRIQKCSYDRYNGTTTQRSVNASVDSDINDNAIQGQLINDPAATNYDNRLPTILEGEQVSVDLFHHGYKIILHALDQLRDGLTYRTWEDDGLGNVDTVQHTLAPLKDANSILFAGHSGAAHGLMNSIDGFADSLSGWTRSDLQPFNADVRALFDAHLLPSIESEAAFNEHLPGDMYSHRTLCQAPCESGPPLHYTYDGMRYFSSGGIGNVGYFDGPYTQWDVPLDQSCRDAHPNNEWRCADRFHVLFNHISTAFFIREDFRDPGGQHNDNPAGPENHGHRLFWADASEQYCEDSEGSADCLPTLSNNDFRARVEEQAMRLISDFDTKSEQAISGGPTPTVYLWLPDCAEHAGAFADQQFRDVLLGSSALSQQSNMHDFLRDFVLDATTGVVQHWIDGERDVRSLCP